MPKALISRKHDRKSTELKIKKAAIDIFSKKGFKAATTRDIAQKAQINWQLITRYFGGKEKLLETLFKDFFSQEIPQNVPHPPQKDLQSEIREHINAALGFIDNNMKLIKIMVIQGLVQSKFRNLLYETQKTISPLLKERFEILIEKGKYNSSLPPSELSAIVNNYVVGLMLDQMFIQGKKGKDLKKEIDSFASVFK